MESFTIEKHLRNIQEYLESGRIAEANTVCKMALTAIALEKHTDSSAFDEFWANYPKKADKKRAKTAFLGLPKYKQKKAILDCAVRYTSTDKKYVPNPSTYINGERWEDEMPTNNNQNWDDDHTWAK